MDSVEQRIDSDPDEGVYLRWNGEIFERWIRRWLRASPDRRWLRTPEPTPHGAGYPLERPV